MGNDTRTYAMLAKPVSDSCNLRCEYCYYLGKRNVLDSTLAIMPADILETYTQQSLAMHGTDAIVDFVWHGGEPTLAGIDFFKKALRLQKKYGRGRKIRNILQTNATLLTDELCIFFKDNAFLLGVSIDGPKMLHNAYRRTPSLEGSFSKTMHGIEMMQRHGIPFNTLTTINATNMGHPIKVYNFLKELTDYIQFLPVVETLPTQYEKEAGQHFAEPPGINSLNIRHPLSSFSVTPEGFGKFLCAIYDEWEKKDRGEKHIQLFDVIFDAIYGIESSLCTHNPLCGHSGCVEADGDIYSCDRYAFPAYKLGNITKTPLGALMEQNRAFGMHKTYGLPEECLDCTYVKLCFGGCPKDRLCGGKNYLCKGYRMIFKKIKDSIKESTIPG